MRGWEDYSLGWEYVEWLLAEDLSLQGGDVNEIKNLFELIDGKRIGKNKKKGHSCLTRRQDDF